MDFTGAYTKNELVTHVEEAKRIVALHQPKSLLALADFSGLDLNAEGRKIIKGMSAHNRPHIRDIALVGLGRWQTAALKVVYFLKGNRNHRLFKDRETAMDWLAHQSLQN